MSMPLSVYLRPFLSDPSRRGTLSHPLLVWEASGAATRPMRAAPASSPTSAGLAQDRPSPEEPLVFELVKGQLAGNALAIGITVGRTPNNDVCVPDESVSRFHAFFQKDEKSDLWTVVDVGSKNGTLAGGKKLEPNRPHYLEARELIVFGSVPLLFLVPETFLGYVDALTGG